MRAPPAQNTDTSTAPPMSAEHHQMLGASMGRMEAETGMGMGSEGSAGTLMDMNMSDSCYQMQMFMHTTFNDYFFLSGWLICDNHALGVSWRWRWRYLFFHFFHSLPPLLASNFCAFSG